MSGNEGRRGILILDMSYTLKMFNQRQLDKALESRTLGGYFTTVISVHPVAGLFESGDERYGPPQVTQVDGSQTFVEGKIGRTKWLRFLPPVNFMAAQVDLFILLVRMSRKTGISVVRIGDPYYLGVFGWLLARRLRVPLATRVPFRFDEIRRVTGRATMPRLLRYCWVEELLERFIFPRCDLIAGANEDNMRYALERGGRPEVATVFRYGNLLHPSHWVEPGRRPDPSPELETLGLQGAAFVAIVARLEAVKRIDDFIRAVAALRKPGRDIRGLIVGDGACRQQLEDYGRSLGLDRAIVFAGTRNQEWIARILPRARAILSPHMGRALVEAALSAVPLVAFDYDWQREIVIDGDTGYLVPNRDWQAMADRAERLLTEPGAAAAMGRRARVLAAHMMDPQPLILHEQNTYTNLLARWSARRGGRLPLPAEDAVRR
jgi:glycosyltransferase involved in cell wall biosynthesis